MSLFPLWLCSFKIYSDLMKLDVINKKKGLEMIIFKLLFLSYMHTCTTLYFSFYHANSIAMLYIVHNFKKRFESTNMDLTHL